MEKKKIMVVDDNRNTRRLINDILMRTDRYEIIPASTGEACLRKLEEDPVNLVLLDIQMPGIDGMQTLKQIKDRNPRLPVIMMTAHGTIGHAVETMREGAYDFVTKPFSKERLTVTVQNALEASMLETEVQTLRSELKERYTFENIVGQSGVMQELFRSVEKVVDSEVTVLIQGESGTGKELFARAIHNRCRARKDKPFVAVNCTALPDSLLESELFGHEKGAFTGAASKRVGKFELANNGTVFLDEIGDMSQSTQAKILRVLQEREFERVGGNSLVKVNIRLISATNKNLEEEVRAGRFREDLFYRVSVFPIKLPPLRERREDILLLAETFLKRFAARENKEIATFKPEALTSLLAYHWPGNVRELENVIERAVVIASGSHITPDDLPAHITEAAKKQPSAFGIGDLQSLPEWIEKIEIDVLRKTLLEFEGNISRTAKKLGIGRATVYRKAKKYNLPISRQESMSEE
ncbi:sigma-54-dependent Fis family transcriptional regulator [bacterium]|nr:sigma-54-dependent Fis family transcriptional regulator [bacterium]